MKFSNTTFIVFIAASCVSPINAFDDFGTIDLNSPEEIARQAQYLAQFKRDKDKKNTTSINPPTAPLKQTANTAGHIAAASAVPVRDHLSGHSFSTNQRERPSAQPMTPSNWQNSYVFHNAFTVDEFIATPSIEDTPDEPRSSFSEGEKLSAADDHQIMDQLRKSEAMHHNQILHERELTQGPSLANSFAAPAHTLKLQKEATAIIAASASASAAARESAPAQVTPPQEPLRRITVFAAPSPGEYQPQELLTTSLPLNTTMSSLRAELAAQLFQRFPNRAVRFCGGSKNSGFLMLNVIHPETEQVVTVKDLPTIENRQAVYDYSKNKWGELRFVPSQAVELMAEIDPAQDQEYQLQRIRDSLANACAIKTEMAAAKQAAANYAQSSSSSAAHEPRSSIAHTPPSRPPLSPLSPERFSGASANLSSSGGRGLMGRVYQSKIVKPVAIRPTGAAHLNALAEPTASTTSTALIPALATPTLYSNLPSTELPLRTSPPSDDQQPS